MVEYASLTAVLAILATSLTGAIGSVRALPASDAKASALVSAAARSQRVAPVQARGAYAKAPYRKPALRYLYTVGWVGAAHDRSRCVADQLLGPTPGEVAAAIRRTPKLLARIRSAGITVGQAATALVRGAKDGCG